MKANALEGKKSGRDWSGNKRITRQEECGGMGLVRKGNCGLRGKGLGQFRSKRKLLLIWKGIVTSRVLLLELDGLCLDAMRRFGIHDQDQKL